VWSGEIPPSWELEWAEDDDCEHHGWPPVVFLLPISLIPLFRKTLNYVFMEKLRFVIIKPFGV
jgi:hypothetical protein